MTDFVKVDFKNGDVAIISKNTFYLRYEAEIDSYHIYSTHVLAHHAPKILRDYLENLLNVARHFVEKYDMKKPIDKFSDDASLYLWEFWGSSEITKEEYDRLCKELGAE